MDIILTQDVPKLGYKNDVVSVKPGYARNYLIPQKYAIIGNEMNKKIHTENMRQASHKITKIKMDAEDLANRLANAQITIAVKTGAGDKIFGSITNNQISVALREKGFEIDRRKISMTDDIKIIGTYNAEIDLHREVKAKISFEVVSAS